MADVLKNNVVTSIEGSYLVVGDTEIMLWTDGKPFVLSLETEDDFSANGINYADFKDMHVGEVRNNFDYEGLSIIRIK